MSFLLSVLVHELGHLLAIKLWKIPVRNIVIGAGGAIIETGAIGLLAESCCAAAGPAAGIVFALAIARTLPQTAVVSVFLSAVNLLPLYPLDGGRILRSVLHIYLDDGNVRMIMKIVTAVVCCALMVGVCWAAARLQMGVWPVFAALILLWKTASGE